MSASESSSFASAIRPPPLFLAEAAGLDFLNTLARPSEGGVEWLGDGRDLVDWLVAARLLQQTDAARMLATAPPSVLDAAASEARDLRAWFRGFVQARAGRPLGAVPPAELRPLNAVLARDSAFGAVVEAGPHSGGHGDVSPLAFEWRRRWDGPSRLLVPVAVAMAELVCEADFTRIKHCQGAACTLVFLDTSKQGSRRWCQMAVCGNRAKQAAHRARSARG